MLNATDIPSPVDALRDRIADLFRAKDGHLPDWTRSARGAEDIADRVLDVLGVTIAEEWEEWAEHGCKLRTCTIPSCLRQFDLVASWTSEGKKNVQESLRGEGWLQSRVVGFLCPEHALILWGDGNGPHNPNWQRDDTRLGKAVLRCSCGWGAGDTRFRGHGTVLWQAHALEVLEASR
jgi:hypothetical protein